MANDNKGYDWSKLIIPGVVAVGAYFLYEQIFGAGGLLGPNAQSAANQQSIQTTDTAAAAQTVSQLAAAGATPTLTPDQFASMANTIFSNGQTGNPVPQANQDIIHDTVIDVNNALDWYTLVQTFGTKNVSSATAFQAVISLPGQSVATHVDDLPTYLRGTLDQAHINSINQFFSLQGINYQL